MLVASIAFGEDGASAVADREELIRLYDAIAEAADARWLRDAKALRRAYENGKFVEGVRQRTEVHGVALQRGDRTPAERAAGKPSRATVRVTRTGCGVYLVLCGYDAIDWRVRVDEGVDLRAVLVYGVRAQRVRGLPPNKVAHKDRVFVMDHRGREYARFASVVARHVPGRTVHTFNGRPEPKGAVLVVGRESAAWRRQMLLDSMRDLERRALQESRLRELRAQTSTLVPMIAWGKDGSRYECDASIGGLVQSSMRASPRTAFALTVDPETGRRYILDHVELQEYSAEGKHLGSIALPAWLARGGFAADLAFDSRRRRLVVVTMAAEFAEYPLGTREWRSLGSHVPRQLAGRFRGFSRDGVVTGMAWDARRDCFWLLYVAGRTQRLRRFSADGFVEGEGSLLRLSGRIQGGARNGTVVRMLGSNVAVFTVALVTRGRKQKRSTSRSFVIDPMKARLLGSYGLKDVPSIPAPAGGDLPGLWAELIGPDCYSAVRRLGRGDDETVAFLRAEWNQQPLLNAEDMQQLLWDLESSHAARRWDAMRRLAQVGSVMRPQLAKAVDSVESPQVRMLLQLRIDDIDEGPDLPRRLDQVLTAIGTDKALAFRALVRAAFSRRR